MTAAEFENLTGLRPVRGDLLVWWIPQVPMDAFYMPVGTLREAKLLLCTLGRYDLFQLEKKVKPDFANDGGLLEFEDGEFLDYQACDDELGIFAEDFDDISDEDIEKLDKNRSKKKA